MQQSGVPPRESHHPGEEACVRGGGHIPGMAENSPAFEMIARNPSSIPVLIAVPHAGRAYPPSLLARIRNADTTTLRLEDRMADRLGEALARETGAGLLVAYAPRALVDLNRDEADVDWEMLGLSPQGAPPPNARARGGLGLVPRRLPGLGEIWRGRLDRAELEERIALVHRPYHAMLAEGLRAIRARWGAALLIDLHSMPPLPLVGGQDPAQIVVGDRFGAACHGALVASTFAHFAARGRPAAHNRPYAGGHVLDRHAAPRDGVHAMQLEIDRSTYLDSGLMEPGEGFAPLVSDLAALVRRLAAEVAALGVGARAGDWPIAAE